MVNGLGRPSSSNLSLPDQTDLPYFVYGLLQPGEIAHAQIESLLEGEPVEDEVQGTLYARDGLPLMVPGEGYNSVRGYLLRFAEEDAEAAYEKISNFEPEKHYNWGEVTLPRSGETANVLVGKRPKKGSIRVEEGVWKGRQDPLLTSGLSVVKEVADQHAGEKFSVPPESFEWERLFRLQMAYMFLWTCIERYGTLAYGANVGPMQKIKRFGEDSSFQRALKCADVRTGEKIVKSNDPEDQKTLNPDNGVSSAHYYYYVRSNITHRGKAANKDGEVVRNSLLELQEIFSNMLEEYMGGEEADVR